MDTGTLAILAVFGLTFVVVIVVLTLKFLKGSLKVTLAKTAFSSGENVAGKIDFKSKKAISSNGLIVELEAYQQQRSISIGGGRGSSTQLIKIYSGQVVVEQAREYAAGYSGNYDFAIKVPTPAEMGRAETGNNVLNSAVKIASSVLGTGRIRWTLKVRLDAKGLDLTNTKRSHVNLINSVDVQNPSTI